VRNFSVGQNRFSVNACDVDSDRESRIFPREPNRTFKRCPRGHQAAACENTALMRPDYGFVYFLGGSEIVAVYNEIFAACLHI